MGPDPHSELQNRIQQLSLNRIHADPDPQPQLKQLHRMQRVQAHKKCLIWKDKFFRNMADNFSSLHLYCARMSNFLWESTEKRLASFQDFPNQGVIYLLLCMYLFYINVSKQLFCTILPLFSTSHTVAMNVIIYTHVHIKRSKKRRQVSKNTLFLFNLRSIRKI